MLAIETQSGTVATFLCNVPPGPCDVSVTSNGVAFYIGLGSAVSSSNGYHVGTTGQLSFNGYTGSEGASLWFAPGSAGSAVTVSAFISTPD